MHVNTLLLFLALLAAPTVAQVETTSEVTLEDETEAAPQNQSVERVEVTGSLIKRVDVEGPSAVQTLDKEYIQRSGWNNLGDLMRDLTVNTFGVNADQGGSSAPSSQFADLRGLGPDRTLVLIDGRIAPKDGAQAAFDMSLIPIAAIERVDIMKDAGSALYGTDALGGVMNIITKKDYNGLEISQDHYQAEQAGGHRTTFGMTYGRSTAKGNFTTSLQVRNNQSIDSRDRAVTSRGLSGNTPSANYSVNGGALQGNFQDSCGNDPSAVVLANGTCRYRYADIQNETPDIRQVSSITNFNYDVNSTTSVFGTFLGSYKETDYEMAPGVVRMTVDGTEAINALNLPGHTAGESINIRWRSTQLGTRLSESRDVTLGGNFGVKRYFGDTWEGSFIAGHSNTLRSMKNPNGYSNLALLKADIEAGVINPFNNTGTVREELRLEPFQRTESALTTAEFRATGDVADGWAGPIGMALGAGYTYETIDITIDEQSLLNNVSGGGASNAGAGSRASQFAVAEIAVPITKQIDMQAATRFDHFDGFGETVNPKLAFAYRPTSWALFRVSGGTGFKAPNMRDLYTGQEGYPFINDPVSQKFDQFRTQYVPNPDLKPETSRNLAAGIVIEPTDSLSFSFDYFDTVINDQIVRPVAQDLNDDENALGRAGAEAKWNNSVVLDRDINNDPLYTISFTNVYETIQRGLDFNLKSDFDLKSFGRLSFINDTTYMFKYTRQVSETDAIGNFLNFRGQPRWRNRATLVYAPTPKFSLDSAATTTGSSFKANPADGKLKMYTRVDLAANFGLFKNTATLRLGVQDLIGDTPPVNFEANGNETITSLYDYTGRRFFAAYRQTF